MEKIITAKGITKIFGKDGMKALNGVDAEISCGEFTAVMGPSGSGKSTLLIALSGMDKITGGSVKFDGLELSALSENRLADFRRTKMGFVFQQPAMLKNLNIFDNIILPAMQGRKKDSAAIKKKAKTLMERTGISGLEERSVTEVSGGQLQRAGICRALINSPRILFADEPTGALNSKTSDEIMSLLADINGGGTAVLIVTHDSKVAARAERILFTKDGSIVSELFLGKTNGKDLESRTSRVIKQMTAVEA